MVEIDGVAPCGGVLFVDELRDGNFGEIGIAHEVGAIVENAAEGFGFEVDGLGGAVAQFREVEAFKDIEDFDERHSAGRRRRNADDVIATIGAANGLTFFDFVGGEIGGSYQASALVDGRSQFAGHGAVVKVVRLSGNAFQGAREFRLLEYFAGLVVVAVAQENTFGLGKLREVLIFFQILRVFVCEGEAIAGEFDGGSDYFVQRQLAVFFLRVDQAGHGAGDADGFVSDDAGIFAGFRDDIALGVEIHVFSGRRRRFFAEVDEVNLAVGLAQKKESPSSEISSLRMDDSERKASGDGGIDGVATGAKHLNARAGSQLVDARDHSVRSVRGAQRSGRDRGGE